VVRGVINKKRIAPIFPSTKLNEFNIFSALNFLYVQITHTQLRMFQLPNLYNKSKRFPSVISGLTQQNKAQMSPAYGYNFYEKGKS
jgi:hypothetical protein